MKEKFQEIIRYLVATDRDHGPVTGIEIADQFCPEEKSAGDILRNLNAAFLIVLSGKEHPQYAQAETYLKALQEAPPHRKEAMFYIRGLSLVLSEIEDECHRSRDFSTRLSSLHRWLSNRAKDLDPRESVNRVWEVFFPEGVSLFNRKMEKVELLRQKRVVRLARLNPRPVKDPAKEILFTSNVLLTVPPSMELISSLKLPKALRERVALAAEAPQIYWYDHPVPVGVETEKNEVLYGLSGLERAMAFEKERGAIPRDARLSCVLSVSVTHTGLHEIARPCVEQMLGELPGFRHLRVYAMSESDTTRIVNEVLVPAASHYLGLRDAGILKEIIGVDGEYGKHYSFLKAISAIWQVLVDPRIRATFKIDLDQVFPQRELVRETGLSALEHLKTGLWGAEGLDHKGQRVELGMIAGALVNQKDIEQGLFTPDVSFPSMDIRGDQWVFYSVLPQALSTEAEMMTRYDSDFLDGKSRCIQRVHVTGGTCGILVESLRRHRPFTPTFIGRAEDQAYLLSVLGQNREIGLRYVHKDGLIMRHDKEGFAWEAMRSASTGKEVGDYVRTLLFSYYARALPLSVEEVKGYIDPFTGCFVSRIPFTLVYLRLALRGALYFADGKRKHGLELLRMAAARLGPLMADLSGGVRVLADRYERERRGWHILFDTLDELEEGVRNGDPRAIRFREKAETIIRKCEIVPVAADMG